MYDHKRQYRCTIIRGKSLTEMDNLLGAYASVIEEVCPCKKEEFAQKFSDSFARFNKKSKTDANHRTEISGKLFSMYYISNEGIVYPSERTSYFLADLDNRDQPAFFKEFVYKMQFPNGMQAPQTVRERVADGICCRPYAFVLRLLKAASTAQIPITKKMVYYYVLNSLDVLQGKASPFEVLEVIDSDQRNGIRREVERIDLKTGEAKEDSYVTQHLREMLDYLELANLIRYSASPISQGDDCIVLNPYEDEVINLLADQWDKKPDFDVYSYDLSTTKGYRQFQNDWNDYNQKLSPFANKFRTNVAALAYTGNQDNPQREDENELPAADDNQTQQSLVELGDEGEAVVFEYEKKRVGAFNPRLLRKVQALGKTRGIGYDIQSVIALPGEKAEFVKYIEVKTTKRATPPDINDTDWTDTFNITRNEYIAATQHKEYYSIFRVYFTQIGVYIFMLTNVGAKIESGMLQPVPATYRIDFSCNAVDSCISI